MPLLLAKHDLRYRTRAIHMYWHCLGFVGRALGREHSAVTAFPRIVPALLSKARCLGATCGKACLTMLLVAWPKPAIWNCIRSEGTAGLVRRTATRDLEREDDGALTASEAGRAARAEAGRQRGRVALGLDDGDLCQARARLTCCDSPSPPR